MYGASRPGFLPGVTEQGAGVQMDRGTALKSAALNWKANQKAQTAARQITSTRSQKAQSEQQRMQRAREQALLEMMYAHSVLGIPIDALTGAVGQGMDMTAMEQSVAPGAAMDNMAMQQPAGQPLAGSLGM